MQRNFVRNVFGVRLATPELWNRVYSVQCPTKRFRTLRVVATDQTISLFSFTMVPRPPKGLSTPIGDVELSYLLTTWSFTRPKPYRARIRSIAKATNLHIGARVSMTNPSYLLPALFGALLRPWLRWCCYVGNGKPHPLGSKAECR
jgi:hypothetical protein